MNYYRADIDGLRAIAVTSVILFHIKPDLIPGGFVGVDIFFVISGYLITFQIIKELSEGRFSILEFYRRRVKRIAPAMLVVISATLILSQLILLPADAEKVAESSLWSVLSLANVYFWLFQDLSYFATASNELPLLHLWSLGVEEQFYIFWPLILLATFRFSKSISFYGFLILVTIGSFVLGQYYFDIDPSFVYYMMPTRAGELMIGALLAFYIFKNPRRSISNGFVTGISIIGLILIFVAFYTLSDADVFPGFNAIPPTLGTAFLIFAGHYGKNTTLTILGLRPMKLMGRISYSAYLWHWPILAFFHYGYKDIGPISGVILFIVTLLIAWLSYRYIEMPARNSRKGAISIIARQFVLPSCVIGLLALTAMKIDGYGFRYFDDAYKNQVATIREKIRPAHKYEYVCQSQVVKIEDATNPKCVMPDNYPSEPDVILWGDSNAAHYVGMLASFAKEGEFSFRNLQIGSCPPIRKDPKDYVQPRRLKDCRASKDVMIDTIQQYKVVIIAASWNSYQNSSTEFLQVFYETVHALIERGKHVILIGKVPVIDTYDRLCLEKSITFPFVSCDQIPVPLSAEVKGINQRLLAFASNHDKVEYFDVVDQLCSNGLCSAHDKSGNPVYYDKSHITLAHSWRLGEKMLASGGLPTPFESISTWLKQ